MTKEDLARLDSGVFLNDVIIDFYLKSVSHSIGCGSCQSQQGAPSEVSDFVLLPQVHLPGGGGRCRGRAQSRLQQLLLQAAEPAEGGGRERRRHGPVGVSLRLPARLQQTTVLM